MKNWKLPPDDSNVARYVECYWFLQKEVDDVGNNHPKLNPDPSAHLILAEPNSKYRYTQDGVHQIGIGSHWIFPYRKTFVMDHSQPFRVIGIKFHVGALYSLDLKRLKLIIDQVESLNINELIDSESFGVTELLTKAESHQKQARDRLDELLLPWVSDGYEDKHSELVRRALTVLADTAIAQIGKTLHCSQRTIERSFLRVTELTLKQCQSMIRLEAMLNYLHVLASENVNWVDVAAKFQFSDQPHLIRCLKSSIGATPGQYSRQRDLAIDVYGNFE